MKVLIIEDEIPAANRLKKLIKNYAFDLEVVQVIDSVIESVSWLENNPPPDLIFLDINLADGLGFEIFRRVKISSPIIFTTAYDDYALKAFELNSIDYLLKPIDEKKLGRSIEKLKNFQNGNQKSIPEKYENLIKNFQPNKQFKSRFLVRLADKLITINEEQIAFFNSQDKVTFIITKDDKKFPLDGTLEELAEELNPQFFFRLNRQLIAHIDAISGIFNYFNGRLKIKLSPKVKEDVFVSREKSGKFKAWLDGEF